MALTPISLFQGQGNGIAQFLQGGQNALASALNNVIQVGRDTVNKQFAQERDFLGEQKRVEDLAQRRGENLQQQSNFDRTFARNLFVSDRDFADENSDQARAEKRMDAQDLFRQTEADRNYDLRKSEAESLQESRDLAQTEAERVAAERKKQDQFRADILAQPQPGASVKPELTAEFLYGPVTATATAGAGTAEERSIQAEIRMKAAEGRDADAYTKAASEKAAADAEIKQRTGAGMTAEERTQERFNMAKRSEERVLEKAKVAEAEKAETKAEDERKKAAAEIELIVSSDFKGFPSAQSFIPPDLDEDQKKAAEAEAKATDANRVAVEVQAALDSPTFDDYLIKSVGAAEKKGKEWVSLPREEKLARAKALGPDVVKKRRKVYDLARKTGYGTAPAAPAAPAATTTAASEIERLKAKQSQLGD